ncbi:MAG: J domain-containing protein, partial [Actinomycetota bacterium]|nr:J domain-containing protein [Actinomycetota bacterium]
MTPYEVLGVAPEATAEEIRRAYLALARRHHPDFYTAAAPGERAQAERRMQAVNEAWAVLGEPSRRRAHDDRHRPAEPPEEASAFRPDDPGGDEPDPRDQPDVPYRAQPPPSVARRVAIIAPVALFAVAVGVGALGLV